VGLEEGKVLGFGEGLKDEEGSALQRINLKRDLY